MKTSNGIKKWFAVAAAAIVLSGCVDDVGPEGPYSTTSWQTRKVAVIAPLTENPGRLERTARWFAENLHKAQMDLESGVELELEWYDESSVNLDSLAVELSDRTDITAVVGPEYSTNTDKVAAKMSKAGKPLLTYASTSEEVIRKYTASTSGTMLKKPFLWSLMETDISQCEVLLDIVSNMNAQSVALIAPDDEYGHTFSHWIPFLCKELQIELIDNILYSDSEDYLQKLDKVLDSEAEYLISAVTHTDGALETCQRRAMHGDKAPKLLFTDATLRYTRQLSALALCNGVEGVAPYADPLSGFMLSYTNHFGEAPDLGEAQFYDALLLVACAHIYNDCNSSKGGDLNETIRKLTTENISGSLNIWDSMGLTTYISALRQGHTIALRGASGALSFDKEAYTSILHSTYVHWIIYEGKVLLLDYASSDGSKRTSQSLASWQWRAQVIQEISDKDVDINYEPLTDKWAVLVAGSHTWKNYRHQADVLNVYQQLKSRGWDDEHIILVADDDIAYNEANPNPGYITPSYEANNVYEGAQIDYISSDITPADICSILLGEQSDRLPQVVNSTLGSNILFYWSGHGNPGYFQWLSNSKQRFTTQNLEQTFRRMSEAQRFRKALIVTEPCYSYSVDKGIEGIPGVLAISSSYENESSFADNYSNTLGTWLSDRFTNNFLFALCSTPYVTFKDMYTIIVKRTIGSHVSIHNADHFGNMFSESAEEFF